MTEETPGKAARATPVAWLDLSRLTEKNMVYATGFKVNEAQTPLYSAATVTALEAEVERLRAGLERVLSSMSSYDAALADHLRKSLTGAGAK